MVYIGDNPALQAGIMVIQYNEAEKGAMSTEPCSIDSLATVQSLMESRLDSDST